MPASASNRRHPEIDDEPLEAPLVGLGLPRTGSTALSFLLAQDPAARYLRQWESSQPCRPPSTVHGDDPRIERAAGVTAGTRQHVPSSATGPMECQDLMALDFRSHIFLAFAQVPSYSAWLLDADLGATYRYERRVLKLLQWGAPARRWRLKCPTHLLFLDHLDAAFPDARFVMTHRDPTDVMLSVADVCADIAGVFTDHLDRHCIGRLNVEHWSVGMDLRLARRARRRCVPGRDAALVGRERGEPRAEPAPGGRHLRARPGPGARAVRALRRPRRRLDTR